MAVLLPFGHAAMADPTHKAVARRKKIAYLAMIFLLKNNTNNFGEYVQKRYGIVSVRLCRIGFVKDVQISSRDDVTC